MLVWLPSRPAPETRREQLASNDDTRGRPGNRAIFRAMSRRFRLARFGVAALVILFLAIKVVSPSHHATLANGFSDAPFGAFAGYAWIGNVRSVDASFTVPRVASGSPLGEAATWIGAQGTGPPARFVQIGALEGRFWSPEKQKVIDAYFTVWSDTARHYKAKVLFPVSPGDQLSAALTLARGHWTLAITDDTSRKKARFSIGAEAEAPFDQAEWTQEDPGNPNNHARYPQITAPVFQHLTINSTEPSPAQLALYTEWMSVNHTTLAPTAVHDGSFTLHPAPAVSAAAAQYMRLFTSAGAVSERFATNRSSWTPKTPYAHIVSATLRLVEATGKADHALLAARWPEQISALVRASANANAAFVEHARPPTLLTPATFATWNSTLTGASELAVKAGSKLRAALGLPGLGFAAIERR
jgi:Peptidase A4 family